MEKKIQIGVVIVDNTLISAVSGIEDIFYIANKFVRRDDEPEFMLSFLSPLKEPKFSNSSTIKTQMISNDLNFDIIIIPPIVSELEKLFHYPKLIDWLRIMHNKGSMVCSICVGAFLLAQTKLLDNKSATTHWLFEDEFKINFPKVNVKCDELIIDEGQLITAGGATAYLNLTLLLLQKYYSVKSVHKCASLLLIDNRKEQLCYKNLNMNINIKDVEIEKLLQWIEHNYNKELTIEAMAEKINLHKRTFIRRFKNSLNITPNEYIQNLRVEEAKILLKSSTKSFEQITFTVGYNNVSSFRRLFKNKTSLNPGEYRQKFQ